MRLAKKTESCSELADELTSMAIQGVERLVMVEQEGEEPERVVSEWPVGRAFATQAIARTVQKLVERESPFGRIYMLRGYRGERELDRVLVDIESVRAQIVPEERLAQPAQSMSGGASEAFAHVMQMNERLMLQLTSGASMTVTQYTQIIETFRARVKELEDDNAQMRAELRARREDESVTEDRKLTTKLEHERGMRGWDMVQTLGPALLAQWGTHKGHPPNGEMMNLAVAQLLRSVTPDQMQHLIKIFNDEQMLSLDTLMTGIKNFDAKKAAAPATAAVDAAAASAKASTKNSSAPEQTAAPSPPKTTGAGSDVLTEEEFRAFVQGPTAERSVRLFRFLEAVTPKELGSVLTMDQWMKFSSFYDPQLLAKPETVDGFVAWVSAFEETQRARVGAALSPQQRALLGEVLLKAEQPESAPGT